MQCTEERFLSDTESHILTVLKIDGIYRNLRFSKKESNAFSFNLTTWPGYLAITGDMGTYVFSRLDDMFCFFRTDKNDFNYNPDGISINPGYWAEKMQSEKQNNHGREFSADCLMASIRSRVAQWCEDMEEDYEDLTDGHGNKFNSHQEFTEACIDEIEGYFQYKEMDEYRFADSMDDFNSEIHKDLNFYEWWDWAQTHEYTFHYIWCLYAIAWGIEKFDELKS